MIDYRLPSDPAVSIDALERLNGEGCEAPGYWEGGRYGICRRCGPCVARYVLPELYALRTRAEAAERELAVRTKAQRATEDKALREIAAAEAARDRAQRQAEDRERHAEDARIEAADAQAQLAAVREAVKAAVHCNGNDGAIFALRESAKALRTADLPLLAAQNEWWADRLAELPTVIDPRALAGPDGGGEGAS